MPIDNRGLAEDPTMRTLRRHESKAQQLGLALGDALADGLIFRLAVEANATGGVERVVFRALRGEEGHAECAWPIPIGLPAVQGAGSIQLRLIADDGYEAPACPHIAADTVFLLQRRTGRRRTVA
jgi:hypothetical protein